MNPQTLAREAMEWTLSPGECLYMDRNGFFSVHGEGCQPGNTLCLLSYEEAENVTLDDLAYDIAEYLG